MDGQSAAVALARRTRLVYRSGMPIEKMNLQLEPADEADIPAMAALWAEAFPEKPVERRNRELREGLTYGDLTDCWLVRDQGRIAGALRTYRLRMHLHGRLLPTMGLAGVAVAPDFRRRGIGRQMCAQALRIGFERGDVLCALYPFRTSFYRELGFTLAGDLHRYRFHPERASIYPGWDRVVRAPDEGMAQAKAIYDRVAPNTNGLLDRTDRMWGFLKSSGTYLYLHLDPRGRATGYIVVRGWGGPPEKSHLRVRELVAEDREAYLGLIGWLSVQKDQWGTIIYDALPGEDFHQRLGHPRTEGTGTPRGLWFHSAAILRGPMLRVLNMAAIMEASDESDRVANPGSFGVLGDGGLQVRDGQLDENQGVWKDGDRVDANLKGIAGSVLSINEATTAVLRGTLHGMPLSRPAGKTNLGLADVRILDEF